MRAKSTGNNEIRYLYGNRNRAERDRLRQLERLEDPNSIEILQNLGVTDGWHCLEIGAGAGSIAAWLADQVGAAGRVVATDIDTGPLDASRYEVWRHDIDSDPLPECSFDLVHFRHTLIHVPRRNHARVLDSVFRALKPGGTLLAEESDLSTWAASSETPKAIREAVSNGIEAVLSVYESRDMDIRLGSRLASKIEASGLSVQGTACHDRLVKGGSTEAMYQQLTIERLAQSIRLEDVAVAGKLDRLAQWMSSDALRYRSRKTVAVWARKSAC